VNRFSIALRRGTTALAVTAVALATVACSTSSSGDPSASGNEGGGTIAVVDGAVTISAANLQFDANVIQATAGEAFTITLVNNDSAPHNLSIYTEEGGDDIVLGDTAEGGQTVTIEVPALEAGSYYFHCDIHPEMNGSVEVSA
jgi:plastocyanin